MSYADLLDSVLPEYKKISEAPDFFKLEEESKRLGLHLNTMLERERGNRYKSHDAAGNVWLITNPACWRWVKVEGKYPRTEVIRPRPQKVMSYSELRKEGSSRVINENKEAWKGY